MRECLSLTPYLLGPWSAWTPYRVRSLGSGGFESMTDVNDNKGGLNEVAHEKVTTSVFPQGSSFSILTDLPQQRTGYQFEWDGDFFLCSNIIANTTHLGTLSGIKALAVARVPAYDRAAFEGYIALREAAAITGGVALDAANVLGQTAAQVLPFLTNKRKFGGLIARESSDILNILKRRLKPDDVKGAFNTFLHLIGQVSDANMEWKYGWKPMIADMQNVATGVQRLVDLRTKLQKGVRVYGHATDVRKDGFSHWEYIDEARLGSNAIIYYAGDKTTTTHAVASIVRAMKPQCDYLAFGAATSLDAILEINGLQPSAKKTWQLMPLSFMTDWFWNVASLLESLQTLKAPVSEMMTSYGGMYSEKKVTSVTLNAEATGFWRQSTTMSGTGVRTSYYRSVDLLSEIPMLYVPPLQIPTEAGKWFSMAQIAFQRLLRR